MTRHTTFTRATGIPVLFAYARSPWQRGTNENTNGLLRHYLPRGADLSDFTPSDLQTIADELKNRPRRALEWKTPTEVLTGHVALIARDHRR